MKMLVFGSLNIDHVYQIDHLVKGGETLSSVHYQRNEGGKGLNQAIALSKAGQETWMAGAIGEDGLFLRTFLQSFHVNTDAIRILSAPTGHAIIQVDQQGQNSIILYGGANQQITPDMAKATLNSFASGDYLLLQNEISSGEQILRAAKARGLQVVLNPSPFSSTLLTWPLEMVDWFIFNEIEGEDMTGQTDPLRILDAMVTRYPHARHILTLGDKGAIYAYHSQRLFQSALSVHPVDTTAAGDTFTGYFFQAVLEGKTIQQALQAGACAAAITVSRKGAGKSIPFREEVNALMQNT